MYSTVSLLVYTFGLTAFLGLFALWVRQRRLGRPELRGWLYPAIFLSSAAWFALNIYTINYFVLLAGACVFPPLLGRLVGARGTPLLAAGSIAVAVYCLFHSDAAYPGSPEFVYASVPFTLLIAWATASALRRRPGKGNVFILLAATVIIPLAIFTWHNWLSLVMRSLPLTILLVDSYSRRRFLFLDLFAKWGSYFALTLTALTFWFSWIPAGIPPIFAAILMLPIVWGVPRLCRLLGAYLDRHALGRPYTAAQAQRLFLDRLQSAGEEAHLRSEAVKVLDEIFHTHALISPNGEIQLEERPDGRPLFSEDLELLHTLSGMLGFLLENRRLEARRRDLHLEASRSELKALRAQISPHFLFNALNTVADLIPTNPARAEETVEKLAEVFRYTLKQSEKEMASLAEEFEFIRAWLDIQQARFGSRLDVAVHAEAAALGARIPAMALQTLVENAIKHGVAQSSRPCRVEIRATVRADVLRLEVADSGPGPSAAPNPHGHGLRNVRQRLAGYYGERGRLSLERDESASLTRAVIELPL